MKNKNKSQKRVDVENKFTLIGKYRAQSFTVNLRVRKTNCGIVEVIKNTKQKQIKTKTFTDLLKNVYFKF